MLNMPASISVLDREGRVGLQCNKYQFAITNNPELEIPGELSAN